MILNLKYSTVKCQISGLSTQPTNNSAGANEPLKPGEQATSLHLNYYLSSTPTHNRDLKQLHAALAVGKCECVLALKNIIV